MKLCTNVCFRLRLRPRNYERNKKLRSPRHRRPLLRAERELLGVVIRVLRASAGEPAVQFHLKRVVFDEVGLNRKAAFPVRAEVVTSAPLLITAPKALHNGRVLEALHAIVAECRRHSWASRCYWCKNL